MAERRNLAALAAAIETLTFDEAVQLRTGSAVNS